MDKLKIEYNEIIKTQNNAMEWFESDDFQQKFKLKGIAFINECEKRYNILDLRRIFILNELKEMGHDATINEIVQGFKI